MGRRQLAGARVLTGLGLLTAVAYLVWRVLATMSGTSLWLSIPVWAVEAAGFGGAALLVVALWPTPPADESVAGGSTTPMDVVVRVGQQADHEVRATLVALRSVRAAARTILVDITARPEIVRLATEFDALYAATDPADRNGLAVMVAIVSTPEFAVLDAGDIPTTDLVERLARPFADPRVAVVQGMGITAALDSPEHGSSHHHELSFERRALNPALGRHGCGVWTGSGSAARTALLRLADPGTGSALETHWRLGADLLAAGWRVAALAGAPVVAHRVASDDRAVHLDRLQRARAGWAFVFGRAGALRTGGLTVRQRLALLAWSVRPLSALRRVAFLALVCLALLTGSAPFHAAAVPLLLLWVPAYLYTSVGLAMASGWTLRPGDRARWSLHALGPAIAAIRGSHHGDDGRAQYGSGLAFAIATISAVLVLRGVSDRWTHWLGALPPATLMALLLVCLWALALSLDVLRVLARRHQQRRSTRVVSSLSAVLDDRGVSIVDLTPLGAGLMNHHSVPLGTRAMLISSVPTATGVTDIEVEAIVRNVGQLTDGGWRMGIEFVDMNGPAANALVEFCTIEPSRERMQRRTGAVAGNGQQVIYVDEAGSAPFTSGRLAVRLVSLLALVGTVVSTAATAEASPSLAHDVTGTVEWAADAAQSPAELSEPVVGPVTGPMIDAATDTVGDPGLGDRFVVVAVCSLDIGDDDMWGTNDDTYGDPVALATAADGSFQATLTGEACWAGVAPEADTGVLASSVVPALQPLDLSGATTLSAERAVAPAAASTVDTLEELRASVLAGMRDTVTRLVHESGPAVPALPTPRADQVATAHESRSTLSVLVLMIAGLLAASILVGSARLRPNSGR